MNIEANETIAITKATIGNNGYIGTLKGRVNSGSFLRSAITLIIEMIYKVSAPKTAIVIISEVLPVNKAITPMIMLMNKAFEGV